MSSSHQVAERAHGHGPTHFRESVVTVDTEESWLGTPALCTVAPAPSLPPGWPAGWSDGRTSGRFLGEIDLAASPAAIRLARSYIRELVGEYFTAPRAELTDLELLTSEAVTNSVVGARPRRDETITLSALHIDWFVRVEVTDGGPPRTEPPTPVDPFGAHERSLQVITALAADHGTHGNSDGTATFWFAVAVDEGWKVP
jgi:Histidine kinase-like ATPase domain